MDRRIHVAEIHDDNYSFRATATPMKHGWAIEVIDMRSNTLAEWRQISYDILGSNSPACRIWGIIDEAIRNREEKSVIAFYRRDDGTTYELFKFGAKYVVATTYHSDQVTTKNYESKNAALIHIGELMRYERT